MKYLRKTATLKLVESNCSGCGVCLEVCPRAVFKLVAEKAAIDRLDACIECGACALNCPSGAIEVKTGVGCADYIFFQSQNEDSSSESCCDRCCC